MIGELIRLPGEVVADFRRVVIAVVALHELVEGDLEYLKGEVAHIRRRLDESVITPPEGDGGGPLQKVKQALT
jgi:hypothetical protein